MYRSSLKGKGEDIKFSQYLEIPHEVFFNDMSKTYMRNEFKTCDLVYSGIAWSYGYKIFNADANNDCDSYSQYLTNIYSCIQELKKPAFITGGKHMMKYFKGSRVFDIDIDTSVEKIANVYLFTYYTDYDGHCRGVKQLLKELSQKYHKVLDFSCGYGEKLMQFDDFVACDIDRNCLTYLSILKSERDKNKKC